MNTYPKTTSKIIVAICIFVFAFTAQVRADESGPGLTERQSQMWARSCAFCHVDGNAGAPIIGIQEQWIDARQKTKDALLQSVIEGINDMPPLGYCMACEQEDFEAIITFMMSGVEE